MGFRLISDGLDFRGRLAFAFLAALSLACLASSAILGVEKKMEGRKERQIKNNKYIISDTTPPRSK